IAEAVLSEAGVLDPGDAHALSVVTGVYTPDPSIPAAQRFVPGSAGANAVRVSLRRPGTLHFAASFTRQPTIGVSGLATVTPEVSFSVGSRLASLNGGIANAVLSELLGTSVSLSLA